MEVIEQGQSKVESVTELRESTGDLAGYRCPQCQRIFTLKESADSCLQDHAKMLID